MPAASPPASPVSSDLLVGVLPEGVPMHSQAALVLLDCPDEWSAFSRPSTQYADCWESSVLIEGMHCAACALTVEEVLSRVQPH